MNINIKIDLRDEFEVACDAYRAWCKSGKNFATSQHLFDAWDAAVMAYAERYSFPLSPRQIFAIWF